jgi:hypothetical protein
MGLFDLLADRVSTVSDAGLMDRLSRELGWPVDARHGHAIVHFFPGDAITPRRDVIIAHPPGHSIATFSCACRARFASRSMTAPQFALFLARNDESVFGKWQIAIEDGVVSVHLRYTALTGGLDAEHFKAICSSLVGEVAFVEEALRGQGML